MNNNLDLKQTEKASFKLAAYADGIADIGLGLVFILLGLYPATRAAFGPYWNMAFFLVGVAAISFAQVRVKARLTPPRIGIVKPGIRIQRLKKVALLITIALAALMILTWVLSANGYFLPKSSWLGRYGFDILVGLIVLAIFWGMAYALELRRYYLYGVLLALGFPFQAATTIYDGTPWLVAGSIITVIGAFLLARFLKTYPVQDQGEEAING